MSDQAATADRQVAIDAAGWGERVPIWQPHNPAFWLFVIALGFGIHGFVALLTAGEGQYTAAVVSSVVLWTLYILPWAWFLHHKDRFGRETRKLAVTGFLWGGFIATFVMAIAANAALLSIVSKLWGVDASQSWGPAIVAPLVEESSKGVGVVMLVLLAARHVRTSYDGFILGAFVGLGFQVLEDLSYGIGASISSFGFDQVSNSFTVFFTRGIVSGFASHALYTAPVGSGIGAWIQSRGKPLGARLPGTVLPIAAAFVLHGIWDFAAFGGQMWLTLVTAIFAIALVIIVGRWSSRQLRPWMAELLAPELAEGLITEDELTVMVGSPRDRRHYVHEVKTEHGKAAGKAARHVLDAEPDLAEALGDSDGGESEDVDHARSELQRLRGTLETAVAA